MTMKTMRQRTEYGRAHDARLRESARGGVGEAVPLLLEIADPDTDGAAVRFGTNVAYTGVQGDLIAVGLCTDEGELMGRIVVPEKAANALAQQLSETVRAARAMRSSYADALATGETEGV